MPAEPLVSIIIPSYNQARFLRETLESVFSQDYPHIEAIVIDGGSTDGSVEIIREYADRLAHWESEKDRGQSHAINKGYAKSTGEIVNWLCSDDTLLPGAIREIVTAFTHDHNLGAVIANVRFIDMHSEVIGEYLTRYDGYVGLVEFWRRNVRIAQPGIFFRRSVIDGQDFYLDERYHHAMDFDFWCRALRETKVLRIDDFVATYRRHSAAKTTASSTWKVERYQISKQLWGIPGSPLWISRLLGSYFALGKSFSHYYWEKGFEAAKLKQAKQARKFLLRSLIWHPPILTNWLYLRVLAGTIIRIFATTASEPR